MENNIFISGGVVNLKMSMNEWACQGREEESVNISPFVSHDGKGTLDIPLPLA